MKNNWISVDEELPEEGQIILAYKDRIIPAIYERGQFYRYIYFQKHDRIISVYYVDITYWQPLPEIPII